MQNFILFGPSHLMTLACIALLTATLIHYYKYATPRSRTVVSTVLASCCLVSYPVNLLCAILSGTNLGIENTFPFHLCDLTAIICAFALLTSKKLLCELAYFWGLAATLQGLLTPNIQDAFPHLMYFSFFWTHGFIVLTALFLPFATGWRPRKGALFTVFACTQLYAAAAFLLNHTLGTNFGFLAAKPQTASLLDFCPPWPWYILVLECLSLALFALLSLPFYKKSVK